MRIKDKILISVCVLIFIVLGFLFFVWRNKSIELETPRAAFFEVLDRQISDCFNTLERECYQMPSLENNLLFEKAIALKRLLNNYYNLSNNVNGAAFYEIHENYKDSLTNVFAADGIKPAGIDSLFLCEPAQTMKEFIGLYSETVKEYYRLNFSLCIYYAIKKTENDLYFSSDGRPYHVFNLFLASGSGCVKKGEFFKGTIGMDSYDRRDDWQKFYVNGLEMPLSEGVCMFNGKVDRPNQRVLDVEFSLKNPLTRQKYVLQKELLWPLCEK